MSEDLTPVSNDVQAVVRMLAERGPCAWLRALRACNEELANATEGRALVIVAEVGGCARHRIGITPAGHVVSPFPGDGRGDIEIRGSAAEVAGVLLGERSLAAAMRDGILEIHSGDLPPATIVRLRRAVTRQLRRNSLWLFVAGMAPVLRRWAMRLRHLERWPAEAVALVAAKGPALAVAIAAMVPTQSASLDVTVADSQSAAAPEVTADRPAAPPIPPRQPDNPALPSIRKGAVGGKHAGPALSAAVSTSESEGGWSRTAADGQTGDGEKTVTLFVEIRCNTPVRALVCRTLEEERPPTGRGQS